MSCVGLNHVLPLSGRKQLNSKHPFRPVQNEHYVHTDVFLCMLHPQHCYRMALNSQHVCSNHRYQHALELCFYPSPPSCLVIYHHKCQIHVLKPWGGHAAVIDCQRSGQTLTIFIRVKWRFPWKDLRELHLDQRVLDDSAHIQPPFCNIRVVVVQVWWEGEQMRSEIFCRENSKRMWYAFDFSSLVKCRVQPLDSAHVDQNLPIFIEDYFSLLQPVSYFDSSLVIVEYLKFCQSNGSEMRIFIVRCYKKIRGRTIRHAINQPVVLPNK